MNIPTLHSFIELQTAVDRALLFGTAPHVVMLLTWMEVQG